MPRPTKRRNVCCMPQNDTFGPINKQCAQTVTMTIVEYETIRLIDLEEFTQEECARQMNVARTTVQGIYNSARRKLADSLVNSKVLMIEGGEYVLCEGHKPRCASRGCARRNFGNGENRGENL